MKEENPQVKKVRKYRWLRRIARTMLGILIFLLLLVLFIRSPWGQDIIVDQAVSYIKDKTGTEVELKKAFITFDGDIRVEGLYLGDLKNDTLVYSKSLEAHIGLLSIIQGNGFEIDDVEWDGLTARVKRTDTIKGFNYEFLVDAFATAPDTTASEPLQLKIGDISLTNFDIIFKDDVEKMDATVKFSDLFLEMNEIDLDQMLVDVETLTIKNAIINYEQGIGTAFAKASPNSTLPSNNHIEETTANTAVDSPLPFLKAGKIRLEQFILNYKSAPDGIDVKTNLSVLETAIPKADIQNNDIAVSYFNLADSSIELNMRDVVPVTASPVSQPATIEWPDMKVVLDELKFNNNDFLYTLNGATPSRSTLNPDAISLSNINIDLEKFQLGEKNASVTVNELNGTELSGLQLKELRGVFQVDDSQLKIDQLAAHFNNSSLNGNLLLGYKGINSLVNHPETLNVNAFIPQYNFNISDLYAFQPDLATNEYVAQLAKMPLRGSMKATGSTANLTIDNFKMNWGQNTSITATGKLQNVTDVDQLYFNFQNIKAVTTRSTILNFIKEEDLGITLPENAMLTASAKGTITAVESQAKLATSYGAMALTGSFKNGNDIEYDAAVKVDTLHLGKMLAMEGLGKLSLELKSKGKGSDISTLDATLDGTINSFTYNNYELKEIPVTGSMKNGDGKVATSYRDDNINIALNSTIELDNDMTKANANVDLIGIDLRAFGITSQNVKAAGKIDLSFSGDATKYQIKTTVDDGIAVFDEQSYLLGSLDVNAFVQPDSTSLDVKNKMIDLELRSNVDPANLVIALERHIDRYLTTSTAMDSVPPVVMKIKGSLRPAPILRDVILPQLESLDTINIVVDFNENERRLNSDIKLDYLKYAGSEVDSLVISSRSDAQNLKFQLGFKNISSGPVNIKRTALTGTVSENILNLDFASFDDEEALIHFASTLSRKQNNNGIENLIFNLSVEDLILNKKPWSIPASNEISLGENSLVINDFKLTNGAQSVELSTDRPSTSKKHVALLLENFKLQALLSYLNSDEKLATGKVSGEFILDDIYGATGILADLEIIDLHAMEVPLGKLKLDAKSLDGSRYDMKLGLKGEDVDMVMNGDYESTETTANLNLDLELNKISMSTIAGISGDYLKDGSGFISGEFKVNGTTVEPIYIGELRFNDASVNIAMLDTSFTLKNEKINIDNAGITMNKLRIEDAQGDVFTVNGKIGTEDLFTPTFDLKIRARDFTALNSTVEDNELYYGKATFNADATITGNLDIPVVDLDLTIKSVTDVTYVMPATELDLVQRDGIVQFVNKENPDAILTQTEEESATLTGFDIRANFKINNDAELTIIIDPETGDNLKVAGSGDLKFRMTPNGRMSLSGRYEINEGHYELNLYEIVSRKFELEKGGSVTWSGDPFDANLDISAIYKIETSSSAIMASQTSGADVSTKNKFRQVLPFLVYLNVDGQLMQPEISFKLDLPDESKDAVGGQVYSRIQQLNTQDQELNKQVFSLLVLNRFFPSSGTDGSSGGTATIARDNLNQALSDQLNQFGGKLLGNSGIDLNFGLDSYTDYQGTSATERTQLDVTASKKLFNDRLVVSVGSEVDIQGTAQEGEQTPVIGNVSIEYLLSQTGQWRLKGFRKNQYDNVIDGQLIISGISLIFSKEFNEFKTLFAKTVIEEDKKREEAKEKKKKRKEKGKEEEIEEESKPTEKSEEK